MDLVRLNTAKFLQSGDRQAFEWLYLKDRKLFEYYAQKLAGYNDGKDLIQLTCLRLLQYNGTAKDPARFHFAKFFCRSMHNIHIDKYRADKLTCELPENLDIEEKEYFEHDIDILLFYIDVYLTRRQKKVMMMRMKGTKFKFIAAKMKISRNTAVGIFRYGKTKLQNYKEEILQLQ